MFRSVDVCSEISNNRLVERADPFILDVPNILLCSATMVIRVRFWKISNFPEEKYSVRKSELFKRLGFLVGFHK